MKCTAEWDWHRVRSETVKLGVECFSVWMIACCVLAWCVIHATTVAAAAAATNSDNCCSNLDRRPNDGQRDREEEGKPTPNLI